MKFIVLSIFVVTACGENSSNFYNIPVEQKELFLDAICRSFYKDQNLTTLPCDNGNCTCQDFFFNEIEFENGSSDSFSKRPRLGCRSDNVINIIWENEDDYAYFIEVLPELGKTFNRKAQCNFYTIEGLQANTLYKIYLWGVSYSKKEYFQSDLLQVRTLTEDYIPSPVEVFNVTFTFTQNQTEGPCKAFVTWNPNDDHSCEYELAMIGNNSKSPKRLHLNVISDSYQYEITNLEFGTEYAFSIRACNNMEESEPTWYNKSTPSCHISYRNITDKCGPEQPRDLIVNETIVDGKKSLYDANLSWAKPSWLPSYYNACVENVVIHVPGNSTPPDEPIICETVSGSEVSVTFKSLELRDVYHVVLLACSEECSSTDVFCYRITCNTNEVCNRLTCTNILFGVPPNLNSIRYPWETLPLVLTTICILATVVIIIIVIILINRRRAKQGREEKRHKYFMELEEKVPEATNNLEIDLIIKQDPLDDHWELDKNKLHFQSVLGEGAFGIVRRACLEMKDGSKIEVAIKMLKNSPSSEEIRQFTQEIEIMKSVRQHPYIVSLVGCITRGLPEGPLLVVEYCSRGDLQTYLRAAWDKFSNLQRDVIYMDNDSNTSPNYFSNRIYDFHNIDHDDEFIVQPKHLLSIARQVALGMEHLAKMRVVHRDLAARNVLVCENHTVKVSDFGLSRDVYQDNVYCKSGGGKLPIRWMALESLTHQRYTTQSDVWSFGILLWEIVTLGGTPYVGIHSCDLLDLLKRGYRLKCPATCHSDLYTIMQNCWKASPKDRPTFSELCKSLEILLENVSQYLHVENEQPPSINCNNLKSTKVIHDTSYERYVKPINNTFK